MKAFRLLRKPMSWLLRAALLPIAIAYRSLKHLRAWWRFQKSLTAAEMFSKRRYNERLEAEGLNSLSRAVTHREHRAMNSLKTPDRQSTLPLAATVVVFNNSKPRNRNSCVSCGGILKGRPDKSIVCPDCGTKLYLKPNNSLFNSDLLTKDDLAAVRFHDSLLKNGGNFEISITAYMQISQHKRDQDTQEILRHIMNSTLDRLRLSAKSQLEVKSLEYAVFIDYARYLYDIDLNPAAWIEGAKRREYEIILMKHPFDSRGAYIDSGACCSSCAKYHRVFFDKDKILTGQAIPFSDCKNRPNPSSAHPFCEASYSHTLPRTLFFQKIDKLLS